MVTNYKDFPENPAIDTPQSVVVTGQRRFAAGNGFSEHFT
jgi:hypothetical protein